MKIEGNKLTAENGYVLKRIADDWVAGKVIYLGMTYYLNGQKLDEPFLELPGHYTEIPEPAIEVIEPD